MWPKPVGDNQAWTPFDTLRLELTSDGDRLLAGFNSTTRNEVRRADRADDLTSDCLSEPADSDIATLLAFYDRVGPQPGQPRPRRRVLRAFALGGRLHLTRATTENRTLVWHVYFVQGSVALLLHSYSAFRTTATGPERQLYGRANRWLHWQDMLRFANAGQTTYDWGGYYGGETNQALQRIDAFKAAFGAEVVRLWEHAEPVTALGRGYLGIRTHLSNRRSA